MTAPDQRDPDDEFAALLSAADAGAPAPPATVPAEDVRIRLERAEPCLRLLRQARERRKAMQTISQLIAAATPSADLATLSECNPVQPALRQFGRFQIQRELGRGGFGIVFLAHDALLRRDVAIKVPRMQGLLTPEFSSRFLREARAAAQLDHPHIVPIYETGEIDGICFIASAYCAGPNLAVWLGQQTEPVPVRTAAA